MEAGPLSMFGDKKTREKKSRLPNQRVEMSCFLGESLLDVVDVVVVFAREANQEGSCCCPRGGGRFEEEEREEKVAELEEMS